MISFQHVTYTYDGTHNVLQDVNLEINKGEFVCILGGNGSGKSTLVKLINALFVPDTGHVYVDGRDTSNPDNTYVVRSHAGMVFQNPDDQLVATLVEDDVAFGPENLGIPMPELRNRVTQALKLVGLAGFETHETHELSGGQKQRVAIAGALAMHPEILIFDEASAMLDPAGRKQLQEICHMLHKRGYTIVMITHYMEEAAGADRIFVMHKGAIVASGTPQQIFSEQELMHQMDLETPFAATLCFDLQKLHVPISLCITEEDARREIVSLIQTHQALEHVQESEYAKDISRKNDQTPSPHAQNSDKDADHSLSARTHTSTTATDYAQDGYGLDIDHVSYTYTPLTKKQKKHGIKDDPSIPWALRDVSLHIDAGDVVGIAGHTGSGKSTLMQMCNGLLQPTYGHVLVGSHDMSDKHDAQRMRSDVGLLFQYPEKQLFAPTVAEDVAFGPQNLGLTDTEITQRVQDALHLVDLDPEKIQTTNPFTLSGGQQRRVAFAGILAMHPHILILDEPCAGLDPRNHQIFLDLIRRLHDTLHITILMVSHSMEDIAAICNKLAVLHKGKRIDFGLTSDVFKNTDMLHRAGLDQPAPMKMAYSLSRQHIPLNTSPMYSINSLSHAIANLYYGRPSYTSHQDTGTQR